MTAFLFTANNACNVLAYSLYYKQGNEALRELKIMTTTANKAVSAYSPARVATLQARAPITAAIVNELSAEWDIKAASVRAKAVSLGIYAKEVKSGVHGVVPAKKEAIVQEIATLVGVSFSQVESLVTASKGALLLIKSKLAA